ncbi:eppin-like [Saccostrea echinata]|uniref:eppin-like n=1 Tax=Saccostrea echinata TaxID=191078 RepID=UPI002A8375A2|nr:eppin-like [Saccostrea echinata]
MERGFMTLLLFISSCGQFMPNKIELPGLPRSPIRLPFPFPNSLTKPGRCPESNGVAQCECTRRDVLCVVDRSCPGNQKCCSLGCACRRECVTPVVEQKKGCRHNGKFYNVGDTFLDIDGCSRCTCGITGSIGCLRKTCVEPPAIDICSLPKVVGRCNGSFSRWWYDEATNFCLSFTYSGCHGNKNNFRTRQDCLNSCRKRIRPPRRG